MIYTAAQLKADLQSIWYAALAEEGFGKPDPKRRAIYMDWEIESLAEYQKLVSFARNSEEDRRHRQRFVIDYCEPYFPISSMDRAIIPTKTFAPKIIRNATMLYKNAPQRWLSDSAGAPVESAEFDRILKETDFTRRMKDIYYWAVATNLVAVGPQVIGEGEDRRMRLLALTPNQFRVMQNDNGDIVKFLYSAPLLADGYRETVIVVWTPTDHYYRDTHGKQFAVPGNEEMINPYGEIPFAFVQIEQADDTIYTGGLHDLIESCLRRNFFELLQNEDSAFAAVGVWLAKNMSLKDGETLSPRRVYKYDKVVTGEGMEDAPTLENISGTPQSELLATLMDNEFRTAAIEQGIPAPMLETTVEELSGRALRAMQAEMYDRRENDAEVMQDMERRIYHKMQIVGEVERYIKLPDAEGYRVDFSDTVDSDLDEMQQFDLQERMVDKALLSPIDWLMLHNKDITTEEEAIAYMERNRELLNKLKPRGLSGGLLGFVRGTTEPTDGNNA